MPKPIKPGTDNQRPGTYIEVGPRGGQVNDPRIVHIDSGIGYHLRRNPEMVGRKSK